MHYGRIASTPVIRLFFQEELATRLRAAPPVAASPAGTRADSGILHLVAEIATVTQTHRRIISVETNLRRYGVIKENRFAGHPCCKAVRLMAKASARPRP